MLTTEYTEKCLCVLCALCGSKLFLCAFVPLCLCAFVFQASKSIKAASAADLTPSSTSGKVERMCSNSASVRP